MTLPKTEKICVTYYNITHQIEYIVSSNPLMVYTLWKVEGNKLTKLGKDKNPLVLERKYIHQDKS